MVESGLALNTNYALEKFQTSAALYSDACPWTHPL